MTIDAGTGAISWTPLEGVLTSGDVTLTVTDDGTPAETGVETFTITVTPVNDDPTIELPESFTFEEDSSLVEDFTQYIGDIDEDELTLTVSGNENVTVSIDGFVVTFGAQQDFNGTETLTFTVDDSQGRLIASDDVDVIVTPVNDAPVMTSIEDASTVEDTPLTITVSSSDVDTGTGPGDENVPEYSCSSSDDASVVCSVSGDQLTMNPAQDFHGSVLITVTVTDDGGLSDDTDFVLTVNPVNDAPIIEDIASQVMDEDTTLDITLIASDVDDGTGDGDENDLSFSAVSDNASISVSVFGDELTITPDADYFGSGTITVTVTDMGSRLTDETSFDVTVNNVNDAPVSNDISIIIPEDSSVLIEVSGEDVEEDSLSFEVVDSPQHGGLGPSFILPINASGDGNTQDLELGFCLLLLTVMMMV